MVIALALFVRGVVTPVLIGHGTRPLWQNLALTLATLLIASPFLWALAVRTSSLEAIPVGRLKLLQALNFGITILRIGLGLALIAYVLWLFGLAKVASVVLVMVFGGVALLLSRFAEPIYSRIEVHFVRNLRNANDKRPSPEEPAKPLMPWDAALTKMTVSADSPLIMKTLNGTGLRETTGVVVTQIRRGRKIIHAPGGFELLLPGDRVMLLGQDDEIEKARSLLAPDTATEDAVITGDRYGLRSITLTANHPIVGQTVRTSGVRETMDGLIVGIEREANRTLNPDPSLLLHTGDVIWVVGDLEKISTHLRQYANEA
jgi:CPA2 family monovalent cation:H+ antiporter-2